MAAAKHTLGPWHIGMADETEMPLGIFAGGQIVADCDFPADSETAAANASLIAAAPDMLAALAAIVEHEATGEFHTWARKIDAAKAALAKATNQPV